MLKAAVAFAGCRLNRYESQVISESIESCGFEIVPFDNKADLYIINTCGVTEKAEVSSRQLVRRARRIRPDSRIVVTGCYSDLKSREIIESGADLIIPNIEKGDIQNKIMQFLGLEFIDTRYGEPPEFGSWIISGMGDLTRGYVKIQEGCDRKCTYCTIWMSRGQVRSRRADYIVKEVNNLYQKGYKEVVLTGVHIGMYLYKGLNLAGLLGMLLERTDIPRIRLSSLHPSEVCDDLLDLIAGKQRICPHVHLSVQSGDDQVLASMGRDYNRHQLTAIINKLTTSISGITIGADIITGFPGETEKAFENTKDFVESIGINHLHVFSYSPRPNTEAARLRIQISPGDRKKRRLILYKIGRKLKENHLKKFIGRHLSALFEKRLSSEPRILTGLSENYLRIQADGSERLKGEVVKVCPYEINGDILISNIVSNQEVLVRKVLTSSG